MTVPTLQVLDALLAEPNRDDWFAVEVCRLTKLGSGTVTQILFRLEQWGWLKSWWEDATVAYAQRRPRRRFYKLTGFGQMEARQLVEQRFPRALLRWSRT